MKLTDTDTNSARKAAQIMAGVPDCASCGKPNPGWILGIVCRACCEREHRRAMGGK